MTADSAVQGHDTLAAAIRRVRGEYLEMPGLKLTRSQAARLCGLDRVTCDEVLAALVHDRFLTCTRADAFVRYD